MLALVERTRPGPFSRRTVELGTYLGHRSEPDGRLVAMAGERVHPAGYTEMSAVCTDAEVRKLGLATRLIRAVAAGIEARGETPILHVLADNHSAIRVYEALGFEVRSVVPDAHRPGAGPTTVMISSTTRPASRLGVDDQGRQLAVAPVAGCELLREDTAAASWATNGR